MNTVNNNSINALMADFAEIKYGWQDLKNATGGYYIEIPCFQSDWNLLLQVVEKVESLPSEVRGVYFWATDKDSAEDKNAAQKNDFTIFRVPNIMDLYNQVVEFIQWYNLQLFNNIVKTANEDWKPNWDKN